MSVRVTTRCLSNAMLIQYVSESFAFYLKRLSNGLIEELGVPNQPQQSVVAANICKFG